MGSPSFHELRKQASFFWKEKVKAARLALTDVTPAELLTEEAMVEDVWPPDTRSMGIISRAAFEVDDYWRIVNILHKRLWKFDKEKWRGSYKALIILDHLLTHGPERISEEFQCDKEVIKEMAIFQHLDQEKVREKSERILKLLEEDRSFLKEERGRARKLTSGIKGFGSFNQTNISKRLTKSRSQIYFPCNYNNGHQDEDEDEDEDKDFEFLDHPLNKDKHQDRVPLVST
ncbi:hypothetical protein E3N88_07441 [Mikania micrantha]|uniref:ENTH domain-containing protein n=1 Tax=Mikania micrantha TaxID=192012 RepID=A0A5N6PTN3_9ASTR|nr:hypothetical protein E3N88_07441 [Mikania micrantha]